MNWENVRLFNFFFYNLIFLQPDELRKGEFIQLFLQPNVKAHRWLQPGDQGVPTNIKKIYKLQVITEFVEHKGEPGVVELSKLIKVKTVIYMWWLNLEISLQ